MGDLRRLSQHDDRAAERAIRLIAPATALPYWLFTQGHAVDLILTVMLIEWVWLTWRGGWRASDAALRLAPGALMLLALRAALVGLGWPWIALALAASFPVHLADLARRRRG